MTRVKRNKANKQSNPPAHPYLPVPPNLPTATASNLMYPQQFVMPGFNSMLQMQQFQNMQQMQYMMNMQQMPQFAYPMLQPSSQMMYSNPNPFMQNLYALPNPASFQSAASAAAPAAPNLPIPLIPIAAPSMPAAALSMPAAAPSMPAAAPSMPAAAPSMPAAAPSMPAAAPSMPAATPSMPAAAPSMPAATPSMPAAAPSMPAATPSIAVAALSEIAPISSSIPSAPKFPSMESEPTPSPKVAAPVKPSKAAPKDTPKSPASFGLVDSEWQPEPEEIEQISSEDEDDLEVEMLEGNSSNRSGIYLPGINKAEDLDNLSLPNSSGKSGQTEGKGRKKGTLNKATHSKLDSAAKQWMDSQLQSSSGQIKTRSSKQLPEKKPAMKPQTRNSRKSAKPKKAAEEEDDDDVQIRLGKTLAAAYVKASSPDEEDGDVRALRRAGVILPNGFTPMPPLHHLAGEQLLNIFK